MGVVGVVGVMRVVVMRNARSTVVAVSAQHTVGVFGSRPSIVAVVILGIAACVGTARRCVRMWVVVMRVVHVAPRGVRVAIRAVTMWVLLGSVGQLAIYVRVAIIDERGRMVQRASRCCRHDTALGSARATLLGELACYSGSCRIWLAPDVTHEPTLTRAASLSIGFGIARIGR